LFLTNEKREKRSCHKNCIKWLFKYHYSLIRASIIGCISSYKGNATSFEVELTTTITTIEICFDKNYRRF